MIMFLHKEGFFQFKYTIEQNSSGFVDYQGLGENSHANKLSSLDLFPFERSDIEEVSLSLVSYEQLRGLTEQEQNILFS